MPGAAETELTDDDRHPGWPFPFPEPMPDERLPADVAALRRVARLPNDGKGTWLDTRRERC